MIKGKGIGGILGSLFDHLTGGRRRRIRRRIGRKTRKTKKTGKGLLSTLLGLGRRRKHRRKRRVGGMRRSNLIGEPYRGKGFFGDLIKKGISKAHSYVKDNKFISQYGPAVLRRLGVSDKYANHAQDIATKLGYGRGRGRGSSIMC